MLPCDDVYFLFLNFIETILPFFFILEGLAHFRRYPANFFFFILFPHVKCKSLEKKTTYTNRIRPSSFFFLKLREQRCCTCNKTTPDSRGWHVQYKTPNKHTRRTLLSFRWRRGHLAAVGPYQTTTSPAPVGWWWWSCWWWSERKVARCDCRLLLRLRRSLFWTARSISHSPSNFLPIQICRQNKIFKKISKTNYPAGTDTHTHTYSTVLR